MLRSLVTSGRTLSYYESFKKNTGSTKALWFNGVEFTTVSTLVGAELKALFSTKPFYKNSKRSIPDNIGVYINARVFAVIFGDDAKAKHASGYYELCLQSFSVEELLILNAAINTNLGLNGRVVRHESPGRFIIRYPVSDSSLIGDMVSNNLPACMHYKILKNDPLHIPLANGAGLPLPLRGDRAAWRGWYQSVK